MRTETDIVEELLNRLRTSDRTNAVLAPDVVFDGAPRFERKLVGAEVSRVLDHLASLVTNVRTERHIVEGAYVATMLTVDTVLGPMSASVMA